MAIEWAEDLHGSFVLTEMTLQDAHSLADALIFGTAANIRSTTARSRGSAGDL